MKGFLFSALPYYRLEDEPGDTSDYFTRWSLFILVAECVGLPVLVWGLTVLHRHRKHKGRVSVFIIPLLFIDLFELLLNPYTAIQLIQRDCYRNTNITCWMLLSLWYGFRHCGVYLQQMMVLESVLTLRRPRCSAHFFLPFSVIHCIVSFISFCLCELFQTYNLLILCLFPLFAVTITSWILTCRTPLTEKQDSTVLCLTTFTMNLYIISLTLYYVVYIWPLFIMSECLLCLRVAIDPLLCVLLCRQEQTHTSSHLSTEHTVVQAENRDCPRVSSAVSG